MPSKSSSPALKLAQLYKVTPATDSPGSASEFSLPLTYLDTAWFRFPPVELLFFYKPTNPITPPFFYTHLLPKLTTSLSKTLDQFLPLAGQLRWPSQSPIPTVTYTPGDGVSVLVAESDADFDRLAGDGPRETCESRPYVPELQVSKTAASVISLQITYFRSRGFSVGLTLHHAVLDAKSASMFLSAWSSICKNGELPQQLTPSFDRTVVEDPSDLASAYLNLWMAITSPGSTANNPRSLNVFQTLAPPPPNLLRATFRLSPDSIERLRRRILRYRSSSKQEKRIHLSSFVITCAFISTCLVKARGGGGHRAVYLVWSVDCRGRLESIPPNYFGNCIAVDYLVEEAGRFMEEDGIAVVAEKISELVTGRVAAELRSGGAVEKMGRLRSVGPEVQKLGVAGSHKSGLYEIDFGLAKPAKMEITSVDKTRGMSVVESGDGSGGVEVGVILVGPEMDAFTSFFQEALKVKETGAGRCSRM